MKITGEVIELRRGQGGGEARVETKDDSNVGAAIITFPLDDELYQTLTLSSEVQITIERAR